MNQNLYKKIRALASTFILLLLLILILCFYYLKYIPDKRNDFHRNAFLELNQIKTAFQARNQGYRDAISNLILQKNFNPATNTNFGYQRVEHDRPAAGIKLGKTVFRPDSSNVSWQIGFQILDSAIDTLHYTLSKEIKEPMSELVSTYKDIFDGYLLILDHQHASDSVKTDSKRMGAIIFQAGDFSIDYEVDCDSLLKKPDGFSVQDLRNITVEGNPYKLFLYPFEISGQRLIVAGLISQSHYQQAYESIPFNFFAIFLVVFLILVIHLPILKIYMLGPNERVRDIDIRLIIGSYFIAAFFGFFLLSSVFLNTQQLFLNKKNICKISKEVSDNLNHELKSISDQLTEFDSRFDSVKRTDKMLLNSMSEANATQMKHLDSIFKPSEYPYLDNVFWINSKGTWIAHWATRDIYIHSPLIDIKDRQYFKDFKKNEALSIPGIDSPITIQPTLSRLDGDYTVTVVKKSMAYTDSASPFLIGLASRMHSVSGVLMQAGYGFSIIDDQGNIQFDSKAGRPLLSNIFKDAEDSSKIKQSVIYRNERYFDHTRLRGKKMALLSTPLNGMPYQLLVYYNLSRSDGFEEHLLGGSTLLVGLVLALLIFSTLVNQWSKTKVKILESRSQHFEWLHPSTRSLKQKYYNHLIAWMILLLVILLADWFLIEMFFPRSEFALLFISLLFPFYIALHYYELRERYYDVQEHRAGVIWYFSRPSLALRSLLITTILIINCFTSIGQFPRAIAWPVLLTQLAWAVLVVISVFRFKKDMVSSEHPKANSVTAPDKTGDAHSDFNEKMLRPYIWAIITGVVMISIIPAFSIFWLLNSQETSLDYYSDQLSFGKQMNDRRREINERLPHYKYNLSSPADMTFISDLKFSHGAYLISGNAVPGDSGEKYSRLVCPSLEYINIHQILFSDDSAVLARVSPDDMAADGSWYFGKFRKKKTTTRELIFRDMNDNINKTPFSLVSGQNHRDGAANLIGMSFHPHNNLFSIFVILGFCCVIVLTFFMTRSLTMRIFLLELKKNSRHLNKNSNARKLFDTYTDTASVRSVMYQFDLEHDPGQHRKTGFVVRLLHRIANMKIVRWGLYRFNKLMNSDWENIANQRQLHRNIFKVRKPDFRIPDNALSIKDIYIFEKNLSLNKVEPVILKMTKIMEPFYNAVWRNLPDRQKFILYDFSQDGFTNYKGEKDLLDLMSKGLLFFDDLRLCTMTLSFQEYVLGKKGDRGITEYIHASVQEDSWRKFKTPLLIILAGVGIFIFFTQDAIYQKITGLLTSLTSLLPVLTNLLGNKENGKTA